MASNDLFTVAHCARMRTPRAVSSALPKHECARDPLGGLVLTETASPGSSQRAGISSQLPHGANAAELGIQTWFTRGQGIGLPGRSL